MNMPMLSLKDVANFINGKAFKPTDWSEEGIPIIRIQNLNGLDKPFNYWAGPLDKEVNVKRNDLLLAWSGTPGTSFGAHIWRGGAAVLNQHIFRVDIKENLVTKEWAKFVINAQLNTLIGMAHGGVGLQHVTKGMVEGLEIPVPPLPEQRRIAAILDQADALRAKRREALAQLDSLTQSIFIETFGDPVTNSLGWKIELLDAVANFFGGNSLPEGVPFIDQQDGYFLMKVSDMNLLGNEKTIERCQSWSSVSGSRSGTCPAGSIVIPKRGGAIGTNKKRITTRETILDPNLMAISPKLVVMEREYLFQWFQRFDLSSIASGSSVPQLNKQDLIPLKIQVPPLPIQKSFVNRIEAIEAIKANNVSALRELDTLFASLQHRAFRGEL